MVLLEGSAEIRVRGEGDAVHKVAEVGRGAVIGEMALVTGEPSSADVVAVEPGRLLALPADDFHRAARRNPRLAVLLTHIIAERLGGQGRDALGDKVVNGYRIVRCVGRGGMAVVYEAIRQSDGQRCALKMLSHKLIYDARALTRFRDEAKVLDTLRHESLVRPMGRFFAFGTNFLVMELCPGPGLDWIVAQRRPLPEERVRPLIGQLARVLDYVHAEGVLHRDVKPSNIMLAGEGRVKLTDFGLARTMLLDDHETQTLENLLIGTPLYMAPEQFRHAQVDRRADYYSLATLIYEMLHGTRLVTARDMAGILREKMEFVPPPAASIGQGISAEMHEFLRLGLAPAPENRMPTLERYEGWAGPVEFPDP